MLKCSFYGKLYHFFINTDIWITFSPLDSFYVIIIGNKDEIFECVISSEEYASQILHWVILISFYSKFKIIMKACE